MGTIQRFFLIDYENVHESGLIGYDRLSSGDTIIFFCSDQARNLNAQILADLQQHKIQFSVKNTISGSKNAMDFQLATEVGRLIGLNHDNHRCIIISKDTGFQAVVNYWMQEQVKVVLKDCISDYIGYQNKDKTPKQPLQTSPKYKWESNQEFAKAVKNIRLGEANKQELFLIFQKCKGIQDSSLRKQRMNNLIVQTFGSEHAGEYYQAVKTLIKPETEKRKASPNYDEWYNEGLDYEDYDD